MTIRIAQPADLPAIVAIYNAAIPGRMATADTAPVTVADRAAWFAEFDPARRPLWVFCSATDNVMGWLSLRSFYGRPAYSGTAELSIYLHEAHRGKGLGNYFLEEAIRHANGFER